MFSLHIYSSLVWVANLFSNFNICAVDERNVLFAALRAKLECGLSSWRLLANSETGGRIVLLLWIMLPCALKERCHSCQRRGTDMSSLCRLAHLKPLRRTHYSYLPLNKFSVKTQTSRHTVFVKIYIKIVFKLLKC